MKDVFPWLFFGGLVWFVVNAIRKGPDPSGPWCTVNDLERDWREFEEHVLAAHDLLLSTTYEGERKLVFAAGSRAQLEKLGHARWVNFCNAKSWVDETFIPAIKEFRRSNPPALSGERVTAGSGFVVENECRPVETAMAHLKAAMKNAANMDAEMSFFFCDMRSPFDIKASINGGDCAYKEVCSKYVGGMNIVKRSAQKINEAFTAFADFARENGVK